MSGNPPDLTPKPPSRRARYLAMAAICFAGLCGALVGYGFRDIECGGDCGTSAALYGLGGAIFAATGVAIISVLVLRAMEEWKNNNQKPDN